MTNKIYESIGVIWFKCRSSFKCLFSYARLYLDMYIAVDFTLSEIGFRDNHLSLISFFHKINIFFVGLIFSIFHNSSCLSFNIISRDHFYIKFLRNFFHFSPNFLIITSLIHSIIRTDSQRKQIQKMKRNIMFIYHKIEIIRN